MPNTFNSGGYSFRVVERTTNHALLAKTKGGSRDFWEVVVIQKLPAQTIYGRDYPEREAMPSNEQWGLEAWSPANEELARNRFKALVVQSKDADSWVKVVPLYPS